MNNDDFKEVPDNIQDNKEETTNNIDNTNDNKSNDYEDVCYICRRPESVAGKMIHIQPNLCICNDCMQKTFDSMSNGNFGNLGNLGNISNMDFGNMPNISMINLSDLTGGIPNSQKLKKKKPKEEKKVAATSDGQPRGALPEGTVVGDGKIKYVLARIDSRLLHGQVATAWTKTTGPNRIIVVSDGVAHDDLRKSMIREAAPPGVKANVVPVSKMIQVSKDTRFGNTKALLLFETPQDALAAIKGGVDIKELNIGSMAHSVGKVAVSKVLSLDEKDIETFEELKRLGVKFDVRKVPSDSQDNMDEILKKAKAELAK